MLEKRMNLKKIISNTAWMLFDKVFILVLNLVVTVKIANYYGTNGYGTYQYAASVVALFEILVTFVDSRVIKKRYSTIDPNELVLNASFARVLFSLFALVGGIVYAFMSKENADYYLIFFILLANAIIINLRFGMQNRYEYLLKSRKVILASNIGLAIGGFLQLYAVSLQLPVVAIAGLTAFSSAICLFIVYVQYRKDFGHLISGRINQQLIRSVIVESLPLAIAASCAVIYSRCDSIMIGNMLSKEEVGIYAIALKIIAVVQIAIAPVRESVYPKMIQLHDTDFEAYQMRYVQITAILTWIYLIGVVASFWVLPIAFQVLKPEYAEAFPIYKIYVFGTFFMYNAGLRAGHFTLVNQGKILMYSQIISVVFNVILNYTLILFMGLRGAALATVITQAISLLFSNLFFGEEGRRVFIWQLKGLNPLRILR